MCHKDQKLLNKIAFQLIGNEIDMNYRSWERTDVHTMRKYVKKYKLHYSEKMVTKAKAKGKW